MKPLHVYFKKFIEPFFLVLEILLIILFSSCSSSELKVAEFEFIYQNQKYILRSAYCSGNPKSCNQIIGNDLVAVDLNQDRIIDKVISGNLNISEAQLIYDYCLNILEKEGKITEVNRSNHTFHYVDNGINYEIKSFTPEGSNPFNQFSIIKSLPTNKKQQNIFIDDNCNGTLDIKLKGSMNLPAAQLQYSKVINLGLRKNKLTKLNSLIMVKN